MRLRAPHSVNKPPRSGKTEKSAYPQILYSLPRAHRLPLDSESSALSAYRPAGESAKSGAMSAPLARSCARCVRACAIRSCAVKPGPPQRREKGQRSGQSAHPPQRIESSYIPNPRLCVTVQRINKWRALHNAAVTIHRYYSIPENPVKHRRHAFRAHPVLIAEYDQGVSHLTIQYFFSFRHVFLKIGHPVRPFDPARQRDPAASACACICVAVLPFDYRGSLVRIAGDVSRAAELADQIAAASREQVQGIRQVSRVMEVKTSTSRKIASASKHRPVRRRFSRGRSAGFI